MQDLIGRTLGHYRIVEKIGAGGMGEVYRAYDERLDRDVAVKVIHESVAQDAERLARFDREAKAVAKLDHPNILAIHDFGIEGGATFAVTELLNGKDLRQSIPKSGMAWEKVVEIGAAIADGLAAAHGKGIVHRDLKPENVFITAEGRVKILDFGLAQVKVPVEDEAETATLTPAGTVAGTVMGTMGYMSPEQLRGESSDARSDIFAFGCVLYEMLSGRTVFLRNSSAETVAAVLKEDPSSLSGSGTTLPVELERAIRRCLEKNPEARFQSSSDLAYNLKSISTDVAIRVTTPTAAKSRLTKPARQRVSTVVGAIVVLALAVILGAKLTDIWPSAAPQLPEERHLGIVPFGFAGDGDDLNQFAAGMTEMLASGLSLIERESREFWVVPIHEARLRAASSAENLVRIFGVTVTLSGKVQRTGDRLRLDLEISDSESGQSLHRLSIEDSVNNVSSFQEGLILQVAETLGLSVTPKTRERLISTATTIPEGFESYLRGLGVFAGSVGEDDLDRAIGLFETATALDPLFTTGRVALGRAYLERFEASGEQEWIDRAAEEAMRAAQDDRWPEDAYELLAAVHKAKGRLPEAVLALEDAVRVSPLSAEAHLKLARIYQDVDRSEDSERHLQRAIFLRPGYWRAHDRLGTLYIDRGLYEEAAIQYSEVVECAPQFTRGYNNLSTVLSRLGRTEEAREVLERSISIEPTRTGLSNLGSMFFDDGRFADAAAMFERALQEDDSRYLTWGNLGYAYKLVQAPDKANDCFRKAVELAEKVREFEPRDMWVVTDLASYNAELGQRERGLLLLQEVVAGQPQEPQLMAQIAAAFEDLGDREQALVWVAHSLDAGVSRSWYEDSPTLRGLVADERFQRLVQERTDQS